MSANYPDRDGLSEGVDFYFSRGAHDIPENGIKSGLSPCGEVYVGTVKHNGMTMPCKIVPKDQLCYFPYYGKELAYSMCTYLVVKPGYTYEWDTCCEGSIPRNAVRFGRGSNNEPFAVGRVTVDRERCVGKILPSHKVCYIPKSGKEHQYKSFDVLIVKPIYNTMPQELAPGTSIYFSRDSHDIPSNAIVTENIGKCSKIYVGFAQHGNESMPAKIIPEYGLAYYPYDGQEHTTSKFMFLVVDYGYSCEWVPNSNGNVPPNAVKLGRSIYGETFFVGRATIRGEKCVGKILPSHGCCYASHGGREHKERHYDVLVINRQSTTPRLATDLVPGTFIYPSKGSHDIPSNAIQSGISPCGQIYVGFAEHKNMESFPAKIIPQDGLAYYPYDGKEHSTDKFMFLAVSPGYSYEWVPEAYGNVPPNAAKLGKTNNGENFFVGRVTMDDERCVGKIFPSHKCCYVPYKGKEHSKKFYDVLIIKKELQGMPFVNPSDLAHQFFKTMDNVFK